MRAKVPTSNSSNSDKLILDDESSSNGKEEVNTECVGCSEEFMTRKNDELALMHY